MSQTGSSEPTRLGDWAGPPRYLPPPAPRLREDGVRHFSAVTYAMPAGHRPLQLDLWVPPGDVPPPLVVWVHGGAWLFGHRLDLPETLRPGQVWEDALSRGLAVASVDYRLSLEAPFPAQLHDCKAALRYLRAHAEELGIAADRIGTWGESAGGHLALLLGLTGDSAVRGAIPGSASGADPEVDLEGNLGVVGPSTAVDAVVDWYAPTDMDAMPLRTLAPPGLTDPVWQHAPEELLLRDADEAVRAAASPVRHVGPAAPPVLILHGTGDSVVPFDQAEILVKACSAAGAPVELVPVDGAEHIFAFHDDVDALVGRSVSFLADSLKADDS